VGTECEKFDSILDKSGPWNTLEPSYIVTMEKWTANQRHLARRFWYTLVHNKS